MTARYVAYFVVEERRKTARTATHTGVLLLLLLFVVAVFLLFLVSSLSSLLLPSTSLCRKQKVANRTSFYSYQVACGALRCTVIILFYREERFQKGH
jgi:Na+-driven multidrug efflux pump